MLKKALIAIMIAGTLTGCEISDNSSLSNAEIGQIAADYLVDHPEILIKVSEALKKQQAEKYIAEIAAKALSQMDELLNDKTSPVLGSETPKVRIVEFFDYQCLYCKQLAPALKQFLDENKKDVQLVLKETPIFGTRWEASRYAAEMGLSVYQQKGSAAYEKYHNSLLESSIAESQLTRANVDKFAEAAGADPKEMSSHAEDKDPIDKNLKLFMDLGFRGTPALLVIPEGAKDAKDIKVIAGADIDAIKKAVKEASDMKKI